jgi:isoamylase
VHGPWDPGRGLRCNPAKLLLDPYARAVHGEVAFGPEVFGHDAADPDTPSSLDSAGHVPRSIVADGMFRWGADEPLRRSYSDTVIYEVHVKGLTMRHPDVPEDLRGTCAGLAHQAVTDHLTRLGVTAVELTSGAVRERRPRLRAPAPGRSGSARRRCPA